jgi:MYXO-CTERM domain-containing protein
MLADADTHNIFVAMDYGQITSEFRILVACHTIAQETAHNFGLPNHQYEWIDDNSSGCNDPMSYRFECGGQKFFRNRSASCGEYPPNGDLPCTCGSSQNSHLKLQSFFGPGTSLIAAPTAEITMPTASTAANSLANAVTLEAGSARGVAKVELYVNGFKWGEVPGAAFGRFGQPNPGIYNILVPADLPNSIADVQVKAFDDLGLVGESAIVTVTRGPAGGCTSADACAEGQKCEAGKCFWDQPVGEVGDPCTYPQFCLSGQCSDTTIQGPGICTQTCVVGIEDSCPMGLTCTQAGNTGICYPLEEAGCCSTTGGQTPWAPFLFAGSILGFIVLRRRRR